MALTKKQKKVIVYGGALVVFLLLLLATRAKAQTQIAKINDVQVSISVR